VAVVGIGYQISSLYLKTLANWEQVYVFGAYGTVILLDLQVIPLIVVEIRTFWMGTTGNNGA
jgi:hypothetical protein